ncbi:MAG: ATP-binding protein [Balneolaceae bacterium]|nr:ATP-binding protein [Balneolaceae bacterium]MCH8548566.1 ATP-binding protein [Balneolaceae bacterium]
MSSKTFRLELKSTHSESERIPDYVAGLQDQSDLNDDEISTLMLLVSEAVTNAIEHGNQYDANKSVFLEISVEKSMIRTVVRDEGDGFDLENLKDPLKENNLLDEGGRGIFLIREMANSVEFKRGGSELTFTIER